MNRDKINYGTDDRNITICKIHHKRKEIYKIISLALVMLALSGVVLAISTPSKTYNNVTSNMASSKTSQVENYATGTTVSTIAFVADAKPSLGSSIDILKGDFDQVIPNSPGRIDAVVTIGDMNRIASGSSNTDAAYAASTLSSIPIFFTLGNHELGNNNDLLTAKSKFASYAYSPNPGPRGSNDTTYSFDVGSIHIIVLNEYWDGNTNGVCDWYPPSGGLNRDDSCFKYSGSDGGFISDELYNWIANDLNHNTKAWTIVVGHEPLYPFGGHTSDSLNENITNRNKLESLFISKNVTAFIAGHTHYAGINTIDNIFHADAGVIGDNVGNGDNFASIMYAYVNETGYFNLEWKYENPTWSNTGLQRVAKAPHQPVPQSGINLSARNYITRYWTNFTVPIMMSTISTIGSLQYAMSFVPGTINIDSMTIGPIANGIFTYEANNTGGHTTTGITSTTGFTGNGIIANVRLHPLPNFWNSVYCKNGSTDGNSPTYITCTTGLNFTDIIATDITNSGLLPEKNNGSITIGYRIAGDVNDDGRITAADSLLYLRRAVGQDIRPNYIDATDDLNCDGIITAADALKVLRNAVGQNVNLRC